MSSVCLAQWKGGRRPERERDREPRRSARAGHAEAASEDDNSDYISQPAKVMRIGSMVKSLLDEARSAPWMKPVGRVCARSTRRRSRNSPARFRRTSVRTGKMALPSALSADRVRAANRPSAARRVARGPLSRNSGVTLRPAGRRARNSRRCAIVLYRRAWRAARGTYL